MLFDPENKIVKLCAEGINLEGDKAQALKLYSQAWYEAQSDTEKFIAAHYLARVQDSVEDKLKWDFTAIEYALKIEDNEIKATLPSLYLNIAKCHEDLKNITEARNSYQLAEEYSSFLPNDGYGNMIRDGIKNGFLRIKETL